MSSRIVLSSLRSCSGVGMARRTGWRPESSADGGDVQGQNCLSAHHSFPKKMAWLTRTVAATESKTSLNPGRRCALGALDLPSSQPSPALVALRLRAGRPILAPAGELPQLLQPVTFGLWLFHVIQASLAMGLSLRNQASRIFAGYSGDHTCRSAPLMRDCEDARPSTYSLF